MFLSFVSFTVDFTTNVQFPAPSHLPPLSAEAVTQVHSGMNPGTNVCVIPAINDVHLPFSIPLVKPMAHPCTARR